MNNPIFDFIEEGMPAKEIYESMGFDAVVIPGMDDLLDDDDKEVEAYQYDPYAWLEKWEIDLSGGWYLAMKFDSEDGPIAIVVKPKTNFAKLLIEFGETEAARQAAEQDHKLAHETFLKIHDEKMERYRMKIMKESPCCPYCGDDRTGKGSLIYRGRAFCSEDHAGLWERGL